MRRDCFSACVLTSLLVLPAIVGCQERQAKEEPAIPFVFSSLNLRQQDSQGRPAWQITSPEARYDLSRKVAQARELRGTIFRAGKPLYRLTASSGTVLNDGAVIQLEGLATLVRLGSQPVVVRARRLRWFPRQERMDLDQRPTASDRNLQISADRAIFLISQDKLELRGTPELSRRIQSAAGPRPQAGEIVLKVASADWFPSTGNLIAPGPVRAIRRQATGKPPQTLNSPFLRGNSVHQQLVLQSPVRFSDPGAKAQFQGGDTTIDLSRQAAVSRQPFSGAIDKLQFAGDGFELLSTQSLVVMAPGCVIRQPDEALSAHRCQWNWSTQGIQAQGDVVLKRTANNQMTRAFRLIGRVGADGMAEFSSPGSRVKTRVRVPGKSSSSPDGLPAPGKRSPIVL